MLKNNKSLIILFSLIIVLFAIFVYAAYDIYKESHGIDMTSGPYGTSDPYGNCIYTWSTNVDDFYLDAAIKTATDTSTRCRLWNITNQIQIGNYASMSGNVANFSSQNILLKKGHEYCIMCDNSGSIRNIKYLGSGLPVTGTYINWTKGCANVGTCNDDPATIDSITIRNASSPPALSIDNSSFNMTSDGGCVKHRDTPRGLCNTSDGTPQETFVTTKSANCSMQTTKDIFTFGFICHTTGATTHNCNLYNNQSLDYGVSNLQVACVDKEGNEVNSSDLPINMTAGGGGSGLKDCISIIGTGCQATFPIGDPDCAVISK